MTISARELFSSRIATTLTMNGLASVQRDHQAQQFLAAGEAFVISTGMQATISDTSKDLELLQVASMQEHS